MSHTFREAGVSDLENQFCDDPSLDEAHHQLGCGLRLPNRVNEGRSSIAEDKVDQLR